MGIPWKAMQAQSFNEHGDLCCVAYVKLVAPRPTAGDFSCSRRVV
jgi:hypothetical protein